MSRLSRRTLLRGVLGGAVVSIGLPPLDAFFDRNGRAYAATGVIPRRFGLFWWGNGNVPDVWAPTAGAEGLVLSAQLAPLEAIKHKLAIVTGTGVRVPNTLPHFSGSAGFLTGMPPLGQENDHTYAGPTLDQAIAAEIGGETVYRSLQTAAVAGGTVSFTGPYSSNPHEHSPHALFERVFGAGFTAPGEERVIDPKLALRRSVLDVVADQAKALQSRLGQSDIDRLEQHLSGIRDLELQLARMEADPPSLEACVRPDAPSDLLDLSTISARHRAVVDVLVMALACDQTRVFSHMFSEPVNNWLYSGSTEGHHQLTHNEAGDQPQVHAVVVQIMHELAYMLQALDAVPEGDGTLLDNTALLATSEVSLGKTHSVEDLPILIGGSACGALRTGLHYHSATRESASRVALSLIRAMGINRASWGADDAFTDEGLGAIEV
jgi:hypothetical protein